MSRNGSLLMFFLCSMFLLSSIRALCGLNSERNCVHGSDSPHSSAREILFFFGEMYSSGEGTSNHDEL